MRRSALVVLATFLLGTLLPALPAVAAGAVVASPKGDQEITSSVLIEVSVARAAEENVQKVTARLSRNGSDTHSTADLRCAQGCDDPSSTSQRWVGYFNPRSPFGSGPVPNGTWHIQAGVNGGDFSGPKVFLSVPPSPVSNLKAVPQEKAVELTWTKAPEPDISGYRVERRTGEGWQQVASLGPDATSYTDKVQGSGTHSYRVISGRPSGRQSGPELTTRSGSSSAEVSAPPDPPQDKKSPAKPDAVQGGNVDAGNGSGGAAAGSTQDGSGAARRSRPLAGNVPPPPPARPDFGFNLRSLGRAFGLGSDEGQAGEEEGAFGEGEGYSEELDYSGVDPVTGEPVAVPLGDTSLKSRLISQLRERPLLASLAFGLLFVGLAVLILGWIRRSPTHAAGRDGSRAASVASAARQFLFRAKGTPATPGEVPSPTAAPLSPRGRTTRSVGDQDAAEMPSRVAVGSRPQQTTRLSASGSLFTRDAQTQGDPRGAESGSRDAVWGPGDEVRGSRDEEWGSRGVVRPGTSELFPQRRSPATPPSSRDRSGSNTGTGSVKVIHPQPPSQTERSIR